MRVSIASGSFRVTMTSGFEDMKAYPCWARFGAEPAVRRPCGWAMP
jgi:hypothetical protein